METNTEEITPYKEFKNLPDTTTPLNAEDLNEIQKLIKNDIENNIETINKNITINKNSIDNQIIAIQNSIANILSIEESGAGYIKFKDGTMICYGNIVANSSPATVNFPAEFISTPIANVSIENGQQDYVHVLKIRSISKSSISVNQFYAGLTGGSFGLSAVSAVYIAIGRWKNEDNS